MATMSIDLNISDLMEVRVVRWWISRVAHRLARAECFESGVVWSQEDFEQDLRTDLCRRARWFDPSQAAWQTFAKRVVVRRAATLVKARCDSFHGHTESEALWGTVEDNDGRTVMTNQLVPADCHTRRLQTYPRGEHELAQLKQDVSAVVAGLPDRLRKACLANMAATPPAITTWERHLLRQRFRAAGIDGYLL